MSSRHKQSQRQGIFDTKTAIQIFTVFHDRLEMDTEFACDLLAAFTGSDQNGDLFLSFGQPAEPDYRTFIFFSPVIRPTSSTILDAPVLSIRLERCFLTVLVLIPR